MLHPLEKASAWQPQTVQDRLRLCISMLHIHGFMSDTECKKIVGRVKKWLDKHEGTPVPHKDKRVSRP